LIGRFVGIAQKNGMAMRAVKSGDALDSVMISLLPETFTPVAFLAFPASTLSAPTMSPMKAAAGDCMAGFRSRLMAAAKFAGPTLAPVLNFMFVRTVKV